MEKMAGETLNITEENIKIIAEHFPESMEEGKIKFDVLKELLGEFIDESNERYQFTWNGKSQALKLSQTPSTGTLLPCKEKSKDWDTTENLYIEGDNLEVLKLLQKSYYKKIKMIYIDPPYNTGNDFVYKDDFKDSIKNYKEITNQECKANPETNGRFHTDWLNMIYSRLKLAKNLLTDDGVIFISIDDNEQVNLEKISNEIFGENNFISKFVWKKTENIKMDSKFVSVNTEYILCYRKNDDRNSFTKELSGEERYNLEDEKGKYYLRKLDSKSSSYSKGMDYVIEHEGIKYYAGGNYDNYLIRQNGGAKRKDCTWLWSKEKFQWGVENNEIIFKNGNVYNKVRYDGKAKKPFVNYLDFVSVQTAQKELDELMGERIFDHPKPVKIIKFLVNLVCDDGDTVLDFFSGSSTTAHSVMEFSADNDKKIKMISVQLPEILKFESKFENICNVGEERIRKAGNKIKEETNADIDYGFKVFKLDSSNLKLWNGEFNTEEEANNYFLEHLSPLVDGRTNEDLLYELLLKEGMPLTTPIEEIKVGDKIIYSIGMGYLMICLEDKIDMNVVEEIGKRKPESIIFRDSGFEDENAKINTIQELKKYGIVEEVIKSI